MKLEEAKKLRDAYFKKWLYYTFPKKRATLHDVWVVPEDQKFWPDFFMYLDSDPSIILKTTGGKKDEYALLSNGSWTLLDEFNIMFDLRFEAEGKKTPLRKIAREFLEEEGIPENGMR